MLRWGVGARSLREAGAVEEKQGAELCNANFGMLLRFDGSGVRFPRVPGSDPLFKLSDVIVVRHVSSSTRLPMARHRVAAGRCDRAR